jgi:hypothetical protein
MISPSSSAVENRPLKKSSAAIERLLVLTVAPSETSAAGKSDGAAISHGGVAEHGGEVGDRRDRLLHIGALHDVEIGRGRLDGERVARGLDADQFLDPAEIDHIGWRCQPLFHHGDQRMTAGKVFRFRALRERGHCFVDRGRTMVCCLVHGSCSLLTVNRMPDAVGRRGHFELVVADRVRDGVDDRGRCADRAGFAAALDAERIARTQRRGVRQLE